MLKMIVLAVFLASASATASLAITSQQVIDAADVRIAAISDELQGIRTAFASASDADKPALIRSFRILRVRQAQLRSLKRVIPRYGDRALLQIVTYFDLDVSVT